jgi:hypothetical protein
LKLTFDRDSRRQLQVKLWALERDSVAREALRQLLAPRSREGGLALATLARWAETGPDKDMAHYLLSRAALRDGDTKQASAWLAQVDDAKLPLDSLRREAGRMRIMLACQGRMRGGSPEPLKGALTTYRKLDLGAAEEFEAKRLSERCESVGLRKRSTSTSVKP